MNTYYNLIIYIYLSGLVTFTMLTTKEKYMPIASLIQMFLLL